MSIQTELDRLTGAKASLKSVVESKGVPVPEAATLDAYAALVQQIGTGDMKKAVYDPRGKSRDIFAAVAANAPLYTATFLLDGWTDAGEEARTKGYPYTQTVTAEPDDPDAPTVTADSVFVTAGTFLPTGVADTDAVLTEALAAVVQNGYAASGAGTITAWVQQKPAADIPVRWAIRTEVV